MTSHNESKLTRLFVGVGLAAIGILVAAVLTRRATRENARDGGFKALEFLKQSCRGTGDVILQRAKNLFACRGSAPAIRIADADTQAYREDKLEHLGG